MHIYLDWTKVEFYIFISKKKFVHVEIILKTDFLPVCYVNESLDNTLLTLKLWWRIDSILWL